MGARLRLALLTGMSGVLLAVLGLTARRAVENLMEVPAPTWGMSELSDAVIAGTCTIGALGALWHLASAVLALAALPGRSSLRQGDASGLAARILDGWAPLRSGVSRPPPCSSPCPRLRPWRPRGPPARMIWAGGPQARRPPRRPRRRRLRPASPRRAPLPSRTARTLPPRAQHHCRPRQAGQPPPRHRTRLRTTPPPPRTPRRRRSAPTPCYPERACGRSPPAFCLPAPAPRRSLRPGPPCITPTRTLSGPTPR